MEDLQFAKIDSKMFIIIIKLQQCAEVSICHTFMELPRVELRQTGWRGHWSSYSTVQDDQCM